MIASFRFEIQKEIMLSRSVANTFLRSGLSRRGAPGLMRQSAAQQTVVQRRAMGGGGA